MFWIFLWPTPVFLFVIFSDLRFDQVKAQGKMQTAAASCVLKRRFRSEKAIPGWCKTCTQGMNAWGVFSSPWHCHHEGSFYKKNGNGTYGISADWKKKTLRNWKFDNNRFCWRVDGATPMYWRVMVSGGPEVNYLLLGSFWAYCTTYLAGDISNSWPVS